MADQFENKDRRVIPNWRSFSTTIKLGELNKGKSKAPINFKAYDIEEYITAWEANKEIPYAADLISAFIANGFKPFKQINEAANFIITNRKKVPPALMSLSESIINPPEETLSENLHEYDPNRISLNIRNIKNRIAIFPTNPINYVEIARCYSVIANTKKAIRAINIALSLCPENRFILRAAVRFFVHIGEAEYIHNIVGKTNIVKNDPWILSSEIALSTLLGKTSKYIKKGIELASSEGFSPFCLSELNSSLATVEHYNGNIKKTKRHIQASLVKPNDNTLAQTEWINSQSRIINLNLLNYDVPNQYEALARNNYIKENWEDAIKYAMAWFYDIPYSKQPILMSSHIASSIIHNPRMAVSILKKGLGPHPNDPQIINNLAYSLTLDNKTDEAVKYLSYLKNKTIIQETTKICLTATSGLIEYRNGNCEIGRKLYLEAIKSSSGLKNPYYYWISMLNLAREELLINSKEIENIMEHVIKIPENAGIAAVKSLKKQVLELYKERKQ